MQAVLDDIGADAVKTGMLGDAAMIGAICDELAPLAGNVPVVVDPVMVAKGGARLLEEAAVETLLRRLLPLAAVLTPNLPEAQALLGYSVDAAAMGEAAEALRALGAAAVLLKGGHLPGDEVVDVLATSAGTAWFRAPRIATSSTHGTGCTLASAIAAGLAQGMALHARGCARARLCARGTRDRTRVRRRARAAKSRRDGRSVAHPLRRVGGCGSWRTAPRREGSAAGQVFP